MSTTADPIDLPDQTESGVAAQPGAGRILADGLWHNNPGLVQLLGLCPLLAVSNTTVNALGLALATLLVLLVSNITVSLVRPLLRPEIRIPAFVLVIAATVSALELLIQAYRFDLHRSLGIFIPLIVTNCMILGRAEAFAARHPPGRAALDAIAQGLGFGLVLVLLGALREVLGFGTLMRQADQLLGDWAGAAGLQVLPFDEGFLLALLPPGAFIGLGLLVAARNYWLQRGTARPEAAVVHAEPGIVPAQGTPQTPAA